MTLEDLLHAIRRSLDTGRPLDRETLLALEQAVTEARDFLDGDDVEVTVGPHGYAWPWKSGV